MSDNKVSIASVDEIQIEDLNITALENTPVYNAVLRVVQAVNHEFSFYSVDEIKELQDATRHESAILSFYSGKPMTAQAFKRISTDARIEKLNPKHFRKFTVPKVDKLTGEVIDQVPMIEYTVGLTSKELNLYNYTQKFYTGEDKESVLAKVGELKSLRNEIETLDKLINDISAKPTVAQRNRLGHAIVLKNKAEASITDAVGVSFMETYNAHNADYKKAVAATIAAQEDAIASVLSTLRIVKSEANKRERQEDAKAKSAKLSELNDLWKTMVKS